MKWTWDIQTAPSDEWIDFLAGQEVIFSFKALSRFGTFDLSSLEKFKKNKCRCILNLDGPRDQTNITHLKKSFLEGIFDSFDGIRVQDLGLLEFFSTKNKTLQLSVEVSFHNLKSLLSITRDYPMIERLILGPEIPLERLQEWRSQLTCAVEVLYWGKLLIFFSPRHLLSAPEEVTQLWGDSLEGPHKNFFLTQTALGTGMFHPKILSLAKLKVEVLAAKIDYLRIDPQMGDDLLSVSDAKKLKQFSSVREDEFHGYYKVNKSTVLFKNLKNPHLESGQIDPIGEVVDRIKDKELIIALKAGAEIKPGDTLKRINPKGEQKEFKIEFLRDLEGRALKTSKGMRVIACNDLGGTPVRSVIVTDIIPRT